jgi:hypothetical protein
MRSDLESSPPSQFVGAGTGLHVLRQGKDLRSRGGATSEQVGHHLRYFIDYLDDERHQFLVLLAALGHLIVEGIFRQRRSRILFFFLTSLVRFFVVVVFVTQKGLVSVE